MYRKLVSLGCTLLKNPSSKAVKKKPERDEEKAGQREGRWSAGSAFKSSRKSSVTASHSIIRQWRPVDQPRQAGRQA